MASFYSNVEKKKPLIHFVALFECSHVLIHVIFDLSDESIIIVDKDVLNQGFCHLNGVKIDLNVTCELQSSAKLELYVVANEYETNANIFLSCVRYKDGTWKCHGVGPMAGKFNTSFDLLEITLNLNYTVYGGHYLRIISSCDNIQDMKNIHLKACCKFI